MPAIGGITRLLASNKNEMAGERWSVEELAALQNRSSLQGLDLAPSRRWCFLSDTQKDLRKYLDTKEFEKGFYADRTAARGEAGWSLVTRLTGDFQGSHLWGMIAKHRSADNADKPHGWRQNEFARKAPGTLAPDAVQSISTQMQASFDEKPHLRQRKGWSWTEIGNTPYRPTVGPGMPGSVHLSQLAPQQLQYAHSDEDDAGLLLESSAEESFDLPALNPKLMRLLSTSSPSLLASLPRQSPATGQLRISDMSRLPSLSFQLRGAKPARVAVTHGKFTWVKAIRRLAELKFWRSNAKIQVGYRESRQHPRRASISSVMCDFDASPMGKDAPNILAADAYPESSAESNKSKSTLKKMKNAISLLFSRLSKHATNKVTHQSSQIKEASPKSKQSKPQWLSTSNGRSKRNMHQFPIGGDSAFERPSTKNKLRGHIRTVAKHIVTSNRLSNQVSGNTRVVSRASEVQKEGSFQGKIRPQAGTSRCSVGNPVQQSHSPHVHDAKHSVFEDHVLQASPSVPARADMNSGQSPVNAMNIQTRLLNALPSMARTEESKIRGPRPTHTRGRIRTAAATLPDCL